MESAFRWVKPKGVALAARLILRPKVLILDEPTAGVDTNSAQLIKKQFYLQNKNITQQYLFQVTIIIG